MLFADDTGAASPYGVFGVTSQHFLPGPVFPVPGKTVVNLRRPLTSVAHELGHALSLDHADTGWAEVTSATRITTRVGPTSGAT